MIANSLQKDIRLEDWNVGSMECKQMLVIPTFLCSIIPFPFLNLK
jgi:hypothetical protein